MNGFCRIPGFDRNIPGFDRNIPADIPSIVRTPSTLDLWIKCEFVFIFEICEYDVTCYQKNM